MCEKKCKVQNQVWEEKKHFSVNAYRINSDPDDIMSEVYENGPVEVAFTVYEVMSSRFVSSFPCIITRLSTNFVQQLSRTMVCITLEGQIQKLKKAI